jgi:heptosyltransferase II
MAAPASNILVVGPAWVGDMVMAQSLFAILKRQNPGAAIDVLAPRWTLPLLRFMPEVREAITQPVGHGELALSVRYRLGRDLSRRGYDLAFVLPGSLKSALIPRWAGARKRRGYGGPLRRLLLTDARAKPELPQVESYVGLADWRGDIPAPRLTLPPGASAAALAALALARPGSPVLAIAPGAEYGPAKRWPARHFAAVAQARLSHGWEVWLLGSPADRETTGQIPCTQNLAGRTSLDQATALLALADAVLTNDSGLMHVAAALNRPQVALFGPSDPARTGPRNPAARVLRLGLDCSPCNQRVCPLKHHRCLEDLLPETVLAALSAAAEPTR